MITNKYESNTIRSVIIVCVTVEKYSHKYMVVFNNINKTNGTVLL